MERRSCFRGVRIVAFLALAAGAVYAMPPGPGVDVPRSIIEEQARLGVNVVSEPVRDAGAGTARNGPGGVLPLVSGTKPFIVVPIRYPDFDSSYAAASFQSMLFGSWASGTAHDYYAEVSYGIFNLTGNVAGWCLADSNRAYYGYANGSQRAARLVKEAAQKADAAVNYAQYDNNGDGYVDAFTCIHSGYGAEETSNGSDIWSHAWSLSSAGIGVYTTNDPDPVNGGFIKVNSYTIDPERSNYSNYGSMACIGVYCHEWGHALGLPDLYDTDGGSSGLGLWDLMAAGSWGGNYSSPWWPVHPGAWGKMELGWLNPRAVRRSDQYSLNPVETAPEACWLISNNRTFREYFLVERRSQTLFDIWLPGQGVLVYHIDDSVIAARRWWNQVNAGGTGWKYGVALEQADNADHLYNGVNNGDGGDPFPGSTSNVNFDSTTTPNSRTNYPSGSPLMTGCYMRSLALTPPPAATATFSSGVTGAFTGGPDAYGNAWVDSDTIGGPSYLWADIAAPGNLLGTGDDARWQVSLPFSFTFCGQSYSSIWACTNGWLSFGANPSSNNPTNTALPNTGLPNAAAYVFWDDLNFVPSDSGGVFSQVVGVAPFRQVVVTWKNGRVKFGPSWTQVTFQALLGEDGSLVFQYQDCATGDTVSNWGHSATVGIEDAAGAVGLQYLYNGVPKGNLLSGGRAIRFVGPPPIHNLAVTRINAPLGTIDSGTVIAPACSVYNLGNVTETYRARIRIGAFYNRDTLVTAHAPGTGRYVAFPSTSAWPRGTHAETCYSTLDVDSDRSNDTATASVTVRVRDVSTVTLFGPSGTIDSGTVVVPQCSVFNYGSEAATYTVRMRIGAFYNNTLTVTNQASGSGTRLTFAPWIATAVGTHAVRCSTELGGDLRQSNDYKTATLTVRRVGGHDVGPVALLAPSGPVDSGTVVTPACSVRNYGPVPETYRVRMRIGGYNDTAHVEAQAPGTTSYVTLPAWTAGQLGVFAVTCTTELAGDESPGNNALTGSVTVQRIGVDVGCTRLLGPSGSIADGSLVTPACSVYNFGNTVCTYQVWMQIGADYSEPVLIVSHQPGAGLLVQFPDWYATPTGPRAVTVFTLAGDVVPGNDTLRGLCSVVMSGRTGWSQMTPVPSVPTLKAVRAGAWLAFNPGDERIYAAKGNKTGDFYSYSPRANNWVLRLPIPPGSARRLPYNGATAAADGNISVYATTGNNTSMFWRYNLEGDTWHELEPVPLGLSGKKVKGGTDIVHVDRGVEYLYLLKGYRNEFYRYVVATDSWEALTSAPSAIRPKWDKGSFLVYDGDRHLYAHKARYHEFWRYDLESQTWELGNLLPGMPLYSNMTGRSRKSRDGGCAAWYFGAVYALKGGNSLEFWRYTAADSQWVELETIPSVGADLRRRKVKAGADIASTDDGAFFALKGGKTFDFWRYLITEGSLPRGRTVEDGREGVMAVATQPAARGTGLAIAPNPLVAGVATVRSNLPAGTRAEIRVFDALGRAVRREVVVIRGSAFALDLRSLAAGVYLVRLDADGYSSSEKLVLQH